MVGKTSKIAKSNLNPSPPCPLAMPLNAAPSEVHPMEKRPRSTLSISSDHPEMELHCGLPKGGYREGLFVRECGDRTNGNGFKFREGVG